MRRKLTTLLVPLGTALNAFAKWFLVWIFARSAGGAEAVGTYSLVLAFGTPVFVLFSFGLRTIFLSARTRWPWRTYVLLRFLGVTLGGIVLVSFVAFHPGAPFELGLAIASLKIADTLLDLQLARVQFANEMGHLGAIMVVNSVASIGVAAASVLAIGSPAVAIVTVALVSALCAMWVVLRMRVFPYSPNSNSSGASEILRLSLPVTSSQLFASLLYQVPILFLSAIADVGVVGVYAGAAYLLTAASLVGSTLQTLLITPFRRIREACGDAELVLKSSRVLAYTLGIGCAPGLLVVLAGSWLLRVVYGPGFELGYLSLTLLSIASLCTIGAFIASVTLNVLNHYSKVTFAMGSSCLAALVSAFGLDSAGVSAILVATGSVAVGAGCRLALMVWFTRFGRRPVHRGVA